MRKHHRLLIAVLVSLLASWSLSVTAQREAAEDWQTEARRCGFSALVMTPCSRETWSWRARNSLRLPILLRKFPEAHEALGAVLVELGNPAEAVQELEAAGKLKPGDQEIEANLALAYANADLPEKAIPHFSAAFNLSSSPASRRPGQPSARRTPGHWRPQVS